MKNFMKENNELQNEIEEFYIKYAHFIKYLLNKFGASSTLKNDLTNEIIFRIISNYKSIENERQRNAWISKITRNTYLSYLKKTDRETPLDFPDDCEDSDSLAAITFLLKEESDSQLSECFQGLKHDEREIIKLKFDENLTWKKVGERFGLKEDTVRKRARTALNKLQLCLEEEYI
jgi:RNA polymerase sigma factor (sigma-70 family)